MRNDAVGIMHPAYFVGRNEILEWLNTTLQLRLTRIEETASGAVACQVMDLLFPGQVQMSRVNWAAKSDWEFINNYKVLQSACARLGVQRTIEVDRLIKAKHQDNLEFLQWLKKFFDDNFNANQDYDPIARRALGKGQAKWANTSPSTAAEATAKATARPNTSPSRPVASRAARTLATTSPSPTKREKENHTEEHQQVVMALRQENEKLKHKLEQLERENAQRVQDLEGTVKLITGERAYYFEKLRSIEALIDEQQSSGSISVEALTGVLYDEQSSKVDEDEFEDSMQAPSPV